MPGFPSLPRLATARLNPRRRTAHAQMAEEAGRPTHVQMRIARSLREELVFLIGIFGLSRGALRSHWRRLLQRVLGRNRLRTNVAKDQECQVVVLHGTRGELVDRVEEAFQESRRR